MLNHVQMFTNPKQIKVKKSTESASSSSKSVKEESLDKNKSYVTATPRSYVQKAASDVYATKKHPTTTRIPNNSKPKSSVGVVKAKSNISKGRSNISIEKSGKEKSNVSIEETNIGKEKPNINKEKSIKKQESNVTNTPRVKRTTATTPSRNLSIKDVKTRTAKDLPFVNVTVNSPPSKRKEVTEEEFSNGQNNKDNIKDVKERQRQKTRTLDELEVKVLTPEVVDNNERMKNLTHKLSAKPKSFFVELEQPKKVVKEPAKSKSSDEDVSYEDDFESYESDFESYHSENKSVDVSDNTSDATRSNDESDVEETSKVVTTKTRQQVDEEKMLDSGNFEWNDPRKIEKFIPMDNIDEAAEKGSLDGDVKKVSLTDEGFQEMSSSSGVSSIKTTHTDVLDRELFIDFQKSKDYKRKRQSLERFRRRAKELLKVIKLHEIQYALFEMTPIPYDVYMATFGRSNHMQKHSQTFDDGIDEEVQTEEIEFQSRWTQHPVEFSKDEVYLLDITEGSGRSEDTSLRFSFFFDEESKPEENSRMPRTKYRNNPLRIFFDQKNGAGKNVTMSDEVFENKIKKIDFDVSKLKKFLKKIESRLSNILSFKSGREMTDGFSRDSNWNFSKGHKNLFGKTSNEGYLKYRPVSKLVFSDQKSNLIMTVHNKNVKAVVGSKSLACLWDISATNATPIKVLVAIDDIAFCIFRGNEDGVFVGALEDGSLNLWDLSERANWRDTNNAEARIRNPDLETATKMQTELEREWNLKNSEVYEKKKYDLVYRACAYTSSACTVRDDEASGKIVGLEFVPRTDAKVTRGSGNKTVAQVCSLQRSGVLIIWTIVREKSTTVDMGKAFWSKCKLQKTQTIDFSDYIEVPASETAKLESQFNLTAAKKRLLLKRSQRKPLRNNNTTVNNADSLSNVASTPRKLAPDLPDRKIISENWESGLLCSALKIVLYNNKEYYLVGRNCGEILFCTRSVGIVKVRRIVITNVSTTITVIESSSSNLPCFLVGTDAGNINLCSILSPEGKIRVLLTLDCRSPTKEVEDNIHLDNKKRYMDTAAVATMSTGFDEGFNAQMALKSIGWLSDPCRLVALSGDGTLYHWDLTKSDIHTTYNHRSETIYICFTRGYAQDYMAVVTAEGEVEIHRMSSDRNVEGVNLFNRYISRL